MPPTDARPRTRAECVDGPRPCPWVGCRHHLFLEVNERGKLLLNFPEREPDELAQTCALDVANAVGDDGCSLEETGIFLNLTRERTRQLLLAVKIKLVRMGFDRFFRVGESATSSGDA